MQQRARVRQIPCDMFLLPKRWEKKCNFPMIAGEKQQTKVTMEPVKSARHQCKVLRSTFMHGDRARGIEVRVDEKLHARALSDTGTASMQRKAKT